MPPTRHLAGAVLPQLRPRARILKRPTAVGNYPKLGIAYGDKLPNLCVTAPYATAFISWHFP